MRILTKILFAAFLICAFYSCKKQTYAPLTADLPGTWNMTEVYSNPGGGGYWKPASALDNAQYIKFGANGELTSNIPYLANPTGAAFTRYIKPDSVTLKFIRTDNTYENYAYSIKSSTLEMSPTGPDICIEGCATRFRKTSN